jgi:hypothetical protein
MVCHTIPYSWQPEVFSENLCLSPGSDLFFPLSARPLVCLGFPAAVWPVDMALRRGRVNGRSFGRLPGLARCRVLLVTAAAIAAVLQHVLAFVSGSYAVTRTILGWIRAALADGHRQSHGPLGTSQLISHL